MLKIGELHQAKRGLKVILKKFVRYISAFDYYEKYLLILRQYL